MIRGWLRYLLILFTFFFLFIFLSGYLFFVIFLFIILIFIMDIIAMKVGKNQIELKIETTKDGIFLQYLGGGLLPIVHVQTTIRIENVFFEEVEEKTITFLSSGKKMEFLIYKPDDDYGRIRIRTDSYELRDMLALFKKTILIPSGKFVIRYPRGSVILSEDIISELRNEQEQISMSNTSRNGYMEDKHEVKEYQLGDDLHHVHHKLSYKLSKIMIREFTSFQQEEMIIYLDLQGSKEDCAFVLTNFYTLAKAWINQEKEGLVCWSSMDGTYELSVRDDRGLKTCMNEILSHPRANYEINNHAMLAAGRVFVISSKGITSMHHQVAEGGVVDESEE